MADFRWIGKSEDGNQVLLKRFPGLPVQPHPGSAWLEANRGKVKVGAVLDTETTGLDRNADQVIELAIKKFLYDPATGAILQTVDAFHALHDPGKPLEPEITRLTGLTDSMIQGQAIDWKTVDAFLSDVAIIVAHNAGFDRPMVDKSSAVSKERVWGCSYEQIDWAAKGFPMAKLEALCIYHGYFAESHRATIDADMLLHLLSMNDPATGTPYFQELLANARKPLVRVLATNSPFESKDVLKRRRYSWNAENKVWFKDIFATEVEAEKAWLLDQVYKGRPGGQAVPIELRDTFKA